MTELARTELYGLHLAQEAKMVDFAGYAMPVQYPQGVMQEHLHCRAAAGLFDVGHMGQVILRPRWGEVRAAAEALEALVPQSILGLAEGRQRYAFLTNEAGGIRDDLMVANKGDYLFLVVNAATKAADVAHLRAALPEDIGVEEITERGLIAVQGPAAAAVVAELVPDAAAMRFMDARTLPSDYGELWLSRSGYTGEDGFEISVASRHAEGLARALLGFDSVRPIGLGARDSLRLEAGLCLYGADLDAATSPVEAELVWAMQKPRRPGGARAGGFPGAERILAEIESGPERLRVGLLPEGRGPMRAGTELYADEAGATPVGTVTSGAFAPSLERPVSMAYVAADLAEPGTSLFGAVRGRMRPATITGLPFRSPTYRR